MKRIYTLGFLLFGLAITSSGQYTRIIVELTDKKGTQFTLSNPSAYLSAKAIQRRTMHNIAIDSTDLPISKTYLDSIAAVPNVTIRNQSKWLNQILIITSDPNALTKINSFPFVRATKEVAPAARPNEEIISKKIDEAYELGGEILSKINKASRTNGVQDLQYGGTFNQIHIHEGEYLHNLGFTGNGITIAVLDAGFLSYKTNPAFDSLRLQGRVLGEWDYVMNEASVNEDHFHGAYCLSIIAANRPGVIVGSAPHASFWLLRTEDVFTEYPVEEQNWAAAAEFADSAGTDMISTSLGYNLFDNPVFNHIYPERNGNTTIITRAADLAAHKGILVTASAGNDGTRTDDYKFVSCPADADSVLTVGATNGAGAVAGFSCWGPNSAGKVKPNVVSVGQGTILATVTGNPAGGNGTSYANPNLAGLVACLWEAFPEFNNMEIIDVVQRSADHYMNPDGRFGHGIPNFRIAYDILLKERQRRKYETVLGGDWIKAYPVPYTSNFSVVIKSAIDGKASLQLSDAMGRQIERKNLEIATDQYYQITFANAAVLAKGVYFIRYNDGKNKKTIRVVKQ
ncbi:MAG TPA: S8 family peptidase [Chitinophagaceae bacterium]|nr:S8 family peptidase [Chitinophagaceae bacterium]